MVLAYKKAKKKDLSKKEKAKRDKENKLKQQMTEETLKTGSKRKTFDNDNEDEDRAHSKSG